MPDLAEPDCFQTKCSVSCTDHKRRGSDSRCYSLPKVRHSASVRPPMRHGCLAVVRLECSYWPSMAENCSPRWSVAPMFSRTTVPDSESPAAKVLGDIQQSCKAFSFGG